VWEHGDERMFWISVFNALYGSTGFSTSPFGPFSGKNRYWGWSGSENFTSTPIPLLNKTKNRSKFKRIKKASLLKTNLLFPLCA
jgi:hypothetical protein